jgi:hypothetical protein
MIDKTQHERKPSFIWPMLFALVSWGLIGLAMFWGQLC